MKTGFTVHDGMTTKPVMAGIESTVQDCAKLMADHNVGSLLLHKNKKITGIVTEEDIVRKAVQHGKDMKKTKVSDIMETALVTIGPEQDIYDAILVMKDNDIRQLPVMENDKLVGFITLKDILKIEPQLFETVAESIELREEKRKPVNEVLTSDSTCDLCGNYSKTIKRKNDVLVCKDCR